MITQIRKKFNIHWFNWIKKRNPSGNPQKLSSHNIYILPSSFGWIYGLVLLTLFSGAINYQISSIFLMTFLLTVIGLISAWEAHANIKGLSLRLIEIEDTQEGKPAQINLLVQSKQKTRFGIDFQVGHQSTKTRVERIPPEGLQFFLPIETTKRGYFLLPHILISSFFPFGIFRIWSYAYFEAHYYVYPYPTPPGFWPNPSTNPIKNENYSLGDEELYDLKQVENPWLQPNRIAWKIAAKEQGWYVKNMESNTGNYWLFKLNDLSMHNLETRLQYLSYWLQMAEANHYVYGLELPNISIPYSSGQEHLKTCLRQLALY